MNKAKLTIKADKLIGNDGRLEWLPKNPREWTRIDLDRTARSIEEDPDFLEDRPILAVPFDKKYIVFAGNLRLAAIKEKGIKDAPVVVYFPETDEDKETVKRRAMKDNGSFGSWDWDTLANEWDDMPLEEFGVKGAKDVDKEVAAAMKDKEIIARVPFTEILGEEHNYVCLYFDNKVDWLQAQTLFGIEPVKAMPTKKGGEQSLSYQKRIGVGRVINGAKAIEKLLTYREDGK